jgi:hypothetical protein
MATYNTIRNPLLDNEDSKSHSHQRFKGSTSSFKSFISQSYLHMSNTGARIGGRRIVPSFSKDKKKHQNGSLKKNGSIASLSTNQSQRHRVKQRNDLSEPLVHYNGPLETLDQLPQEKLDWITKESTDSEELRQPLLDYPRSIVFRKPHNRNL